MVRTPLRKHRTGRRRKYTIYNIGFKVDETNSESCPTVGFVSSNVEPYGSMIELCTVLNHLLYGYEIITFVLFCG
jgi:hypothetical protein